MPTTPHGHNKRPHTLLSLTLIAALLAGPSSALAQSFPGFSALPNIPSVPAMHVIPFFTEQSSPEPGQSSHNEHFNLPVSLPNLNIPVLPDVQNVWNCVEGWQSAIRDAHVEGGKSYSYEGHYRSPINSSLTARYKMYDGSTVDHDLGSLPAVTGLRSYKTIIHAPQGAISLTVMHGASSECRDTLFLFFLQESESSQGGQSSQSSTSSSSSSESSSSSASSQSSSSVPSAGNLIANASFEQEDDNGMPVGWLQGQFGTHDALFHYPLAGIDGEKAAGVTISQYTDGDAKWYFQEISVTPGTQYEFSDWYKSTGPHTVSVQYRDANNAFTYAQLGTPAQSNDWQRFTGTFTPPAGTVAVTIFHVLQGIGSLTVDGYSLKEATQGGEDELSLDKGYVTLAFDDGWLSHYTNVRPMLNAAGMKGSFFLISNEVLNAQQDNLGDPYGYGNVTQFLQLQSDGHEISAHTETHASLISLPPQEAREEIEGSKNALVAAGFSPVETFVYPFGEYNNDVIQMVKDAGFIGARSVETGYNTKATDPYILKAQNAVVATTIEEMRQWVDFALENKVWLTIVFHQVDDSGFEYSTDPADLQALVNYLQQRNAAVVTLREGLGLLD